MDRVKCLVIPPVCKTMSLCLSQIQKAFPFKWHLSVPPHTPERAHTGKVWDWKLCLASSNEWNSSAQYSLACVPIITVTHEVSVSGHLNSFQTWYVCSKCSVFTRIPLLVLSITSWNTSCHTYPDDLPPLATNKIQSSCAGLRCS